MEHYPPINSVVLKLPVLGEWRIKTRDSLAGDHPILIEASTECVTSDLRTTCDPWGAAKWVNWHFGAESYIQNKTVANMMVDPQKH